MERSQEIFLELEGLEATRDGIEKRWTLANNNLGLHQLVHELLIKQVIGPQEEVEKLRKELSEKLRVRDAERDTYLTKWEGLRKSLDILTRPAIEKGIEKLNREFGSLKVEKKVISRTSGGFSMTPKVVIETNEDGIFKVQSLVREAIKTLRSMNFEPISEIEAFVQAKLKEIGEIDLKSTQKEIDELEFERREWLSAPPR